MTSPPYTDKGTDPRPRLRAIELRKNATEAERRLWRSLSARQLRGTRFNRQVPIGPFICDFVARTPRLIVEVDGGQHAHDQRGDRARTRFLERRGYRVLRFWNNEVLENQDGVLGVIDRALATCPPPTPPASGRGVRRPPQP